MTAPRSRRSAAIKALLASFAVYLLPVIGPHMALPWGGAIVMELASLHRREPLWLAADIALAVILQLAAFLLLYWMFRRPAWWRVAILAAAVPVFFAALLGAYMVAIPTYFLVERDTAPALGGWPELCKLPDSWLDAQRAQIDMNSQATFDIWVSRGDGTEHALLTMPDCVLRPNSEVSLTGSSAIDYATPAGDLLYRVHDQATGSYQHFLRARDARESKPLPSALLNQLNSYWTPLLSVDGTALAWLERVSQADGAPGQVIRTRDIATGVEQTHETGQPLAAQLQLLYFDSRRREFLFSRYPNEAFAIDASGAITWGPVAVDGIDYLGENLRRVAGGWVAWDSYREKGRYRVAWSLPSGMGVREIPLGRSINSVSTTSTGDLIAVSVSSADNIGAIQDAVFVFRTRDGQEVFRRYLSPYTRTPVQFLGTRYLAMSTMENGKAEVVVMQVLR
jgi:hypothetical protein